VLAVGGWTHVHIAGQSLAVVHVTMLASQCDVLSVVHPQSGSETPESTPVGGEGGDEFDAAGVGTPPPPELALPPSIDPVPAEPVHQHCWSGTQEKPSPQSEATWQGGT